MSYMRVDVQSFPPGLSRFLREHFPHNKSLQTYFNDDDKETIVEVQTHTESYDDFSPHTTDLPTFHVHMGNGQYRQVRDGDEPRRLRSGEAMVVERKKYVTVSMLKSDEGHIRQVKLASDVDNQLVRSMLYIFTNISSHGDHRKDAKRAVERFFGRGSVGVGMDALLEQGFVTVAKNGSVTATAAGRQAASGLKYEDDPTSMRYARAR